MTPFEPIAGQLIQALKVARISKAIGGFDITLNEHQKRKFAPHWQPHAWILVPEGEIRRRHMTFRKHFPKAIPTVCKPVMIKRFNRSLTAIAYALKGDFQRRVTLPKNTNRDGSTRSAAMSDTDLSEPSKTRAADDAGSDWPRKPRLSLWRRGDRSTERLSDLTDTSETIDTA